MVTRKQRAGEIQESIRRVLLDSRDPFQVSGEPTAQDEYDGCIAGVYRLLVSGAPPEQVAQHLRQIADEWLGPAVGVGDADLRSLANSVHSRCDLGARVRLPNQAMDPTGSSGALAREHSAPAGHRRGGRWPCRMINLTHVTLEAIASALREANAWDARKSALRSSS